jgi:hypothetical protein
MHFIGEIRRATINKLSEQVDLLYKAVHRANHDFWPALAKPDHHLFGMLGEVSPRSVEEMQRTLQFHLATWWRFPELLTLSLQKVRLVFKRHRSAVGIGMRRI